MNVRGNPLKANGDMRVDLRGSIVPVAMLEFTRAFREMEAGSTLEILLGDRETKITLFKVLRAYPYELLDFHETESFYRVRLRKEGKKGSEEREGRRNETLRKDAGPHPEDEHQVPHTKRHHNPRRKKNGRCGSEQC